jgi:hypothetical protein
VHNKVQDKPVCGGAPALLVPTMLRCRDNFTRNWPDRGVGGGLAFDSVELALGAVPDSWQGIVAWPGNSKRTGTMRE